MKLIGFAGMADADGYTYAAQYLLYWLEGQRGGGLMSADAAMLASYYSVVGSQIDSRVRQLMSQALAAGETSFAQPSDDWGQHAGTGKRDQINMNPMADNKDSITDWYLAFDDVDYRVAATMSAPNQITFQYQIFKAYSFDHDLHIPFLGGEISENSLIALNSSGLAQDFYIVGTSSPITIGYGG